MPKKRDQSNKHSNKSPNNRNVEILGIDETAQRRKENAQQLQSVNVLHRAGWAYLNKDGLKDQIARIQIGLHTLSDYLQLKDVKDPSQFFISSVATTPVSTITTRIRVLLSRLHESLKAINIRAGDLGPHSLSVQLREKNEDSREELKQAGVKLRNFSQVFNLHRHASLDPTSEAITLAVETIDSDSREAVASTALELKNLARPVRPPESQPLEVETWGYFVDPDHTDVRHVLFHDITNQCKSTTSLADIVGSPEFRRHITPIQIVQLARLLTVTYLYFEPVRRSCGNPRLENFRYYQEDGESPRWIPENPVVFSPLLFFWIWTTSETS